MNTKIVARLQRFNMCNHCTIIYKF